MDHMKVLRRAWQITWRYRALWVFGVILALTAFGRGGGGGGGGGSDGGNWNVDFVEPEISPQVVSALIAIGIGLLCLIVFAVIAAVIARYVAETALIRMVDDYEQTGERRSVRQGFRWGWSRTAGRLFLIDLLVWLPTMLAFLPLILLALAPLLLWATGNPAVGAIGVISTIGLCFLTIVLGILVVVALLLLTHFFKRVCVLEGLGVIESVREGYAFVRQHLRDVIIMGLIMIGVELGWMMAMIPVFIVLAIAGLVMGGLLALIAGGLTGLATGGAAPWIVAGVVGIPVFLLVLVVPLALLGGLVETFKSSVWTLTYRELRALDELESQ